MGDPGDAMHNESRQPVEFDPQSLRLTIGEHSTLVSDPALGNEAVLRSYLGLVAEVRGTPIGSGIEVRHDDVVVLAQVLDLTDTDLESHLQRLLGVSAAEAANVGRRLRRRRAFATAMASVTVGGLALLGATNVAASPSPSPSNGVPAASSQAEVTTTTSAVEQSTTVTTLPPVTEPPATTPPPAVEAPHSHPTSPDDVQIGDALVIERGTQPADQSTQIDNAVTYER